MRKIFENYIETNPDIIVAGVANADSTSQARSANKYWFYEKEFRNGDGKESSC